MACADRYYANYHAHIFNCYLFNGCINITNIWVKDPACTIARYLANMAVALPAFISLYISFDRYTSIVKPYSSYRFTLFRVKLVMTISWSLILMSTIATSTTAVSLYNPFTAKHFVHVCYFIDPYESVHRTTAAYGFGILIIVYLVTITLYLAIIAQVRMVRHRVIHVSTNRNSNHRNIESRLCIITGIIAVMNLVSWLPGFLIYIAIRFKFAFLSTNSGHQIATIGHFLLYVNSSLNPICYMLLLSRRLELKCCNLKRQYPAKYN
ncbi:Tachykinin-like peptides receptor 86C [Trichoplax sp. H2]|nr:Tachykinin-like peptides receptor 86C [Trichoplax sp. H2]|eukprot:RDD36752.1 Tachykinin-like peptides receptor 86C [Trichoplax sp. H2]